jgi:hypothetical protein
MKRINVWKLIKDLVRAFMRSNPSPTPNPEPPPPPTPPHTDPDPAPAPTFGVVTTERRAFADSRGLFNAIGASLFWALWGERHDQERLESRNISVLAGRVDYVRILAMVGSETWSDRVIDPRAPDYWQVVDALFTRLRAAQLRAHVTIFADAQVMMPSALEREHFAASWASHIHRLYRQDVIFVEVANEYWQNGVGRHELRRLGDILKGSGVPVALSAPTEDDVCGVYGGWDGIATLHYDRDTSRTDGPYRPIRQPWGYPGEYMERERYTGPMPDVAVNSEPIGPESSVASELSPERIALAVASTFISGNAGYCFHTGAGIRGGGAADLARGRKSNLDEYDVSYWLGIDTAAMFLVPGQANGARQNAQWSTMPWNGSQYAVERGDLVRAQASIVGDELRAVFIGTARPHTITLRQPLRQCTLIEPVSGDVVERFEDLSAGDTIEIPGHREGLFLHALIG